MDHRAGATQNGDLRSFDSDATLFGEVEAVGCVLVALADHHDITVRADVLGGTMDDRRNVTRSISGLHDHASV